MWNRNPDDGIGRQMGIICCMTYHDTAAWADHALGLDGNEMLWLLVPVPLRLWLLLVPVPLRLLWLLWLLLVPVPLRLLLFLHLLHLLHLLKLLEL